MTEQSAYTGYYCELWKHIYVDGELQESVMVNSSQYEKVRGKIRVGTKKKKDKDDKDKDKNKDDDKNKDPSTSDNPEPEDPVTDPSSTDTPEGMHISLLMDRQMTRYRSRWILR